MIHFVNDLFSFLIYTLLKTVEFNKQDSRFIAC